MVVAPNIQIDKVPLVHLVGHVFEQVHHLAGQRQPAILWSYRNGGDMPMPFGAKTFSFSNDYPIKKTCALDALGGFRADE
jgi:hypothetical protein